ncbi:lysozyme inhibitor LprI family protein [Magnetococcales bacterium HHB-1]
MSSPSAFLYIGLFLSLIIITPLHADPEIDCRNATHTIEMTYCAEQAYKAADGDLNFTWKTFTKDLNKAHKKALIKAQRTWIKFRDLNCHAETFPSRNGREWSIYFMSCQERMTRQRTEELRNMLESN